MSIRDLMYVRDHASNGKDMDVIIKKKAIDYVNSKAGKFDQKSFDAALKKKFGSCDLVSMTATQCAQASAMVATEVKHG